MLKALPLLALLLAGHAAVSAETGEPAPACELTAFGAPQAVDLRAYRGKVVYVDFWASWCASCAKSFPFLNALDSEFRASGLQIVGVNVDEDADDARAFLAKRPATFDLAADASGECPRAFGVVAMPSSYLVDREGRVRHVFVGFRAGEAAEIRGLVEKLLAEPAAGGAQ